MNRAKPAREVRRPSHAALDELIEQITVDAYGEDEQLWAFRQAFEDEIALPCDALVVGEPVSVVAFDYDGNERRGLTAKCRRPDGRKHVVAAADVEFPRGTEGERYVGAYRKWIGLAPFPHPAAPPARGKAPYETVAMKIDAHETVELAVLSAKGQTAHCRLLGRGQPVVTLRTRRHWVPGEIVTVEARKEWTSGDPHLSAEIKSERIDARALGLTPLRLEGRGPWNPIDQYWGEEGQAIEQWAEPIIARGPRPAFEMEQVLPGYDFSDPDDDPIGIASDLTDTGKTAEASEVLMELCRADLRCLDAHAHLGNLVFYGWANDAVRHYETGFRIGELALPEGFDGVLPWGHIDNRPFLRCMRGFGLCLWRLGQFSEAGEIFERMLWLNPSDNQGVRFLLHDVGLKRAWEDRRDE